MIRKKNILNQLYIEHPIKNVFATADTFQQDSYLIFVQKGNQITSQHISLYNAGSLLIIQDKRYIMLIWLSRLSIYVDQNPQEQMGWTYPGLIVLKLCINLTKSNSQRMINLQHSQLHVYIDTIPSAFSYFISKSKTFSQLLCVLLHYNKLQNVHEFSTWYSE